MESTNQMDSDENQEVLEGQEYQDNVAVRDMTNLLITNDLSAEQAATSRNNAMEGEEEQIDNDALAEDRKEIPNGKKKGMSKILLIIIVLVVLAVGGFLVYWFFFTGDNNKDDPSN